MDIAISTDTIVDRLEHRAMAMYEESVNELAACLPRLTRWEEDHLLGDEPAAADKADHKATVQHMLRCARFLALATRQPDFPDQKLADLLASVIEGLEFKMDVWHSPNPMTLTEADEVLKKVFGENCLNEP